MYMTHDLSVERLRQEGNAAFAKREFDKAVTLYSQAIERQPDNHVRSSFSSSCIMPLN